MAAGHTPDPLPGEDPSERLAQLGKTEIPLTLSNRQKVSSEDEEQDVKGIFVRTKRMVVEMLNAQPSDSLTEVLDTPATPEQEEVHQQRQKKKEEAAETKKPGDGLKRSQSLVGDSRSVCVFVQRESIVSERKCGWLQIQRQVRETTTSNLDSSTRKLVAVFVGC